ncbi:MAG: hypothetical protein L3K06_01765, partial [Thermoplasmata archaeon]|nr:hypothetical protein [Thermoplasmata archaeon]
VERPMIEHRMMVLDAAASVSFDFRDVSPASTAGPAVSVRSATLAARWTQVALAKGARLIAAATDVHFAPPTSEGATRILAGGESFDAPTAVLADDGLGPAASPGDRAFETMRIEETFALPERSVENRFQLRPGQGASVECLLGFLPAPWTGMGWLVTHRAHLTIGLTLHRPARSSTDLGLEAAFDRFRSHPAVVGYTTAGVRVDHRSYEVESAPTRRRLAAPGLLRVGTSAGLGDPLGVLAPGLSWAIASARAAGEAVSPVVGLSDTTHRPERLYLARLKESGVLEQIDRARGHPIPTGWDGARRSRYAQVLSKTFHELLTETGAPKESITRTLRRVRRESGTGFGSLAWDGLTLGRNL